MQRMTGRESASQILGRASSLKFQVLAMTSHLDIVSRVLRTGFGL